MSVPIPGSAVRGSKTGKPIMALLDLLGRTWALGILWHLNDGPQSFIAIQRRCENISPTLLTRRLAELRATYIIEKCDLGYQLTELGKSLFLLIEPMGKWSTLWSQRLHQLNLTEKLNNDT